MKRLWLVGILLTNGLFATVASAQEDQGDEAERAVIADGAVADELEAEDPVEPAAIAQDVRGYYRGERISAFLVMALGVAGVATGIPLLLQDEDLARGAGWTALIVGGLQIIGAIAYAIDVTGTWNHYEAALAEDPAAFRDEETEHIDGTIGRFPLYLTIEIVMALTGVGLTIGGFAANEEAVAGVGVSLAALWLPIVVIDLINQQRAHGYADAVRRIDVSSAPAPAALPPAPRAGHPLDRVLDSAAVSGGFSLSLSRAF